MSKYIGMVLDGKWKIISSRMSEVKNHRLFLLKNEFNGYEVEINDEMIKKIVDGKSSVSRVVAYRIKQERKGKDLGVWVNVDKTSNKRNKARNY